MRTRSTAEPIPSAALDPRRPGMPFKDLLARRLATPGALGAGNRIPGPVTGAVARGAVEAARDSLVVRSTHHAGVRVREEVRGEGLTLDRERFLERVEALEKQRFGVEAGLHARALEPGGARAPQALERSNAARGERLEEGRIEATQSRRPGPGDPSSAAERASDATSQDRSTALSNLVARIELFVRAQRPALALHLEGLGCSVELERRGPGAVAVTLHTSRPAMTTLLDRAELERALQERGLRLAELRVGSRPGQR